MFFGHKNASVREDVDGDGWRGVVINIEIRSVLGQQLGSRNWSNNYLMVDVNGEEGSNDCG